MKKPVLDNLTRWNSTYTMIMRLLEFKDFCNNPEFNNTYPKLKLPDRILTFMEDFINAFKPVYICTKTLQESQLPFGDFFKAWLNMT